MAPPALAVDAVVASTVETAPGAYSADSIDDPAIWVAPDDPERSLIIGNDKLGALETYDLQGRRVQRIAKPGVFFGNVDVRHGVQIGGRTRDIVAVSHRNLTFYTIDPVSRLLTSITEGTGVGLSGEGLCLAQDRHTGALSVVHITIAGQLRQFLVTDTDQDGLLEAQLTRDVAVGSEAEGCVVNDVTGDLFVAEEDVAIWRYDIDPTTGGQRSLVAAIGDPGAQLVSDIEGLTLAVNAAGEGYLFASAQHVADPDNSYFVAFRATGRHEFVKTFRIADGAASDDCDRTDGIAAYPGPLGTGFPSGVFVCQDNNNDAPGVGNQDFKLARLEQIIGALPAGDPPPIARAQVTCVVAECTFSAAGSTADTGIVSYVWGFGDGAVSTEITTTHTYAAPGTYRTTLTVTDGAGHADTVATIVVIGPAPGSIGFVAAATSPNANATAFAAAVPAAAAAGDTLLLSFSCADSAVALTGPGTGWTKHGAFSDSELTTSVWAKVATANDPGRTVRVATAAGGTVKGVLRVAAYRGTDPVSPIAGVAAAAHTAADSTSHPSGVVTTAVPALRVTMWATKSSTVTTLRPPAGELQRAMSNGSGSGRVTSLLGDSGALLPAAANGGLVATSDAPTGKAVGVTVMLRSAPEPGPPMARFTSRCSALTCSFDASGSAADGGTLAAYEWNFGDESTATGVTASHTFVAPGSYPVALTVRDDAGRSDTTTAVVTVGASTAQVSFVAATVSPSRNATSYRVTVPATVQTGDLLLLVRSVASSAAVSTGPGAAWQALGTTSDGVHATTVWIKIAGASDAGSVVTISTGTTYLKGTLTLLAYQGADPLAPIAAWSGAAVPASTTSLTTPSVAAPSDGLRLSIWTSRTSLITAITPPADEVVRASAYGSGSAYVVSVVSDRESTTGDTGAVPATLDAATDQGTTWTIVLRPAP